ncbi:hypothetical protein GCM10010402_46810 [Actinomadura luteofluorescens]|nr:pfkB family carbohydrate kinase [Actinomadura glauciflava]
MAFDTNYRPAGWPSPAAAAEAMSTVLTRTDIALPTFSDDQAVFGDRTPTDTIRRLRQAGVTEMAVKQGPQGSLLADTKTKIEVPAVPHVKVIDTTAAGDAFNGAYLASRLTHTPPAQAAETATTLAAEVITHQGALLPPTPART